MKAIVAKNIERIIWLGAIILAILLFKRCNDRKSDQIKAIQASAKELENRHKQDSIQFSAQVTRWQDSIYNSGINSDLQAKVIAETEKKLSAHNLTIDRLKAIIRNSPTVPDSSFVLVHPDKVKACDSLPGEIEKRDAALLEKDTAINDLVDLMNYEVVYRDSLIESGKGYIDSLRADYRAQKALLNEALKTGKPRGAFLVGVGVMGNEKKILGGASLKAAYLTKGGKMYQYSAHGLQLPGMESAQIFHEASAFIKLFK